MVIGSSHHHGQAIGHLINVHIPAPVTTITRVGRTGLCSWALKCGGCKRKHLLLSLREVSSRKNGAHFMQLALSAKITSYSSNFCNAMATSLMLS